MIKLCQPDEKKSCSACCGLFNLSRVDLDGLSDFLAGGALRAGMNLDGDAYLRHDVRDVTSYICPYQGFIGVEKPGCLLHPALGKGDFRDRSLFGRKICESFLCPAHQVLDDSQRKILIERIDHWYPYSIGVIDPWFFTALLKLCEDLGKDHRTVNFDRILRIHGRYLGQNMAPIFFYHGKERVQPGYGWDGEELREMIDNLAAEV